MKSIIAKQEAEIGELKRCNANQKEFLDKIINLLNPDYSVEEACKAIIELRQQLAAIQKEQSEFANHVLVEDTRHDHLLKCEQERDQLKSQLVAARAALNQCRVAMLGKVSPAHPAWSQSEYAIEGATK